MAWVPGARIGNYKLGQLLGKGGMAETWRAELLAAEGVRRAVVIKRVLPAFADNAEFVKAFIQEARLTASLSHGNVAQVFDFGQLEDGSHFMAMELIDGASLDRVLKRGIARGYWHMPLPIATLIALEVAKGLEHVHNRRGPKGALNIVHRDISPDNILVGLNGETKLIDFGIAKSALEGRTQTDAGVLKGKAIYFSPEQAQGEKLDFRTDIYALGVVLYRLVTGKKAFDGNGFKVLKAVVNGDHIPARQHNPDLPEELALVVETAMAKDRDQRFANTLDLVEALQAALRAIAPRAGPHWIRGWMHFLYASELEKRKETVDQNPAFLELIAGWKPPPRDADQEAVLSGENPQGSGGTSRPRTAPSSAIEEEPPALSRRAKGQLAAAATALAVAGLLVFAFVQLTFSPNERVTNHGPPSTALPPRPAPPPPPRPAPTPQPAPTGDDAPPAEPAPGAATATAAAPDDPPRVTYDVESAPARFTLGPAHRVLIDQVGPLPASSGTLSELKPVSKNAPGTQIKLAGSFEFRVPDMGGLATGTSSIPPLLFVPGAKPTLDVALGRMKWSGADARVFVMVGAASEIPPYTPFQVDVNGKPTLPSGWLVVVDTNDRFTVRDLSKRTTWKVTVKPQPSAGTVVAPVLLVASGDTVRLDGKKLFAGYGVLTAGKHQLSGATSAWLTMPAVSAMELAEVDLTIEP